MFMKALADGSERNKDMDTGWREPGRKCGGRVEVTRAGVKETVAASWASERERGGRAALWFCFFAHHLRLRSLHLANESAAFQGHRSPMAPGQRTPLNTGARADSATASLR